MTHKFKRITSLVVAFLVIISAFSLNGSVFKVDAASYIEPITVKTVAELDLCSSNSAISRPDVVYSGCYGNQLNMVSKTIYDALVEYYVEDKKFGTFSEPLNIGYAFTATVNGNQIMKDSYYYSVTEKVQKNFQGAMNALLYDYPELYWFRSMKMIYDVKPEKSYSYNRVSCSITNFKFYPDEIYNGVTYNTYEFYREVDETYSLIKSKVDSDISTKDLLKTIHDYICEEAYYSYNGAYIDLRVHSPEPLFIGDGGVVCEGYAKTFKILCDKFGVECILVSGNGTNGKVSEAHMWNYVKMDDSKWYLVDVTWDDQEEKNEYMYFLASANTKGMYSTAGEEHAENGDFAGNRLVYFNYPTLSTTEYKICAHKWGEYTIDEKATLNKDGAMSIHCLYCTAIKNEKTINKPNKFTLSTTKYTYNGKVKSPNVTITNTKGNKLKKNTDYTFSYTTDRKSVGRHKVVVTLKGNYSGKKTLYYTILPTATSKIATSQTIATLKATWNSVTGATGYKVQLLNSKGETLKTKYTKNRYYRFEGLSGGKTYKVKVTAYKLIDGEKVYSTKYKTITSATKPAKPTLKVTASSKKAKLSWNRKCCTGYEITYSTKSNFKSAKKVTVSGYTNVKKTISKLTKGKKYYFRIRAYKTVGSKKIYSDYSAVKVAKIK